MMMDAPDLVLAAAATLIAAACLAWIAYRAGVAGARRESARRAELLGTVARTARSVSALETDQVLEAVVAGATTLGLEAGNLALFDELEGIYRVAHAIGLPAEYVEAVHPADAGMPGLVRARRETVVVDDYAGHPNAIPALRDEGFRAALATPVWVHGRMTAALVAGTRQPHEVTPEEVEAFELLAALAGRALENARAFEDERRTAERLADLDRLKGDFLSNVSHELRTPLTAVSGMGLTLEQQWDELDEDTRRELLNRLNANARTLDRIIGNLLDYSRLEAGRMEVRQERIRIDELLDQAVARLRLLFATHPLSVEAERGLIVLADPMLLDRVVENLLSNAVKHTPPGTAVTVEAVRDGGQAVVAVADEGPGIPPEEQRHLGDRFFRGRHTAAQRTRGTGLGLALVREILRLHGAELEVQSAVGVGTRFAFRLPAEAELPAPSPSGAASTT
jgi:signal transduction histidine kinase